MTEAFAGSWFIEVEGSCREAWCCGAGGSVYLGKRAFATAHERLDEAVQTGAGLLVTSCPLCIENFSDAKQKYALPVELIYLAELVALSIV